MADIRFWLGMLHRAALKRNDKLLIGNIDTTEPNYIDISELLSVLTTDDLPESLTRKFVTAEEKAKLAAIVEGVLTLAVAAEHFYPKNGNPSGFLTAASNLAAEKLTGLLAADLIPDLDAAKITTGSFPAGRIPDLDASKITSGQFDAERIPTLPADKIEGLALELGKYILASSLGKAFGPLKLDGNAMVPDGNIPNLDASKITSGTFAEDRLPNVFLKAAQIVDNWSSQAVNLPVSANAVRLLKEYIDGMLSGLKVKQAAFVATTGNVVLAGEQIIDGIQTNLSRILVRAQANPAENGIYLTGPEAWTRAEDANTGETISSSTVPVTNGDTLGGLKFICSVVGEIGVDPVTWTEVIEFLLNEAQYQKVDNLPEGQVETVDGAQAKADAALLAANDHTDTAVSTAEKWKGSFLTQAALEAAYPVGQVGWCADVDAGAGANAKRWIWDEQEGWVPSTGDIAGETSASIKTKLLANEDTYLLNGAMKAKIEAMNLPPLPVSTSRPLAPTDKWRKLYVTANVTLTYPAGGLGADFEFNAVTSASGVLQAADESAGADLEAPDGTILEGNKMGHFFVNPDGKLMLLGGFKV